MTMLATAQDRSYYQDLQLTYLEQADNDMSDNPTTNGAEQAADNNLGEGVELQVLGQYIKDLSFESPNAPKSLQGQMKEPKLNLEVNVHAKKLGDDVYETAIELTATANSDDGPIYTTELVYAGAFRLNNVPENALQPVLLINCPALLFPFARRLLADLTREGGFPPLFLDPIDFGRLFMDNMKKKGGAQPATA